MDQEKQKNRDVLKWVIIVGLAIFVVVVVFFLRYACWRESLIGHHCW